MENQKIDFLGRGWSFPPSFNNSIGQVAMLSDEEDIQNSLEVLLSTLPGERIMQPAYGCNLSDLLFEPIEVQLITRIKNRIEYAIIDFEPRIKTTKIEILTEKVLDGVVEIIVYYEVKATNSRYNLVFPYYVEEGKVKP